jgi:hypothetical protein
MWVSVDNPANWIRSIWLDPLIQKFVPICHTQKTIFNSDAWTMMDTKVCDCPNVLYYKRNEHFKADQFLWEDTFNWGNHKKHGGGRSIMLVAIRMLYYLGFRTINLLGVDFEMKDGQANYSFDQHRHKSSINGNNSTYQLLVKRFTALMPYFEQEGLKIFNCNPDSALKVFPHKPYEQAVTDALKEMGDGVIIDLAEERTEGLYDREYREKKEKEKQQDKAKAKRAKVEAKNYSDDDRAEVKARLDTARGALDDAKDAFKGHEARKPENWDDLPQKAKQAYEERLKELEERVGRRRTIFRTIEDEKRLKWGEPQRWGLWNHGNPIKEPEVDE